MDDVTERIRQRAHEIFVRRGESQGDALSDWLQAEEEIRDDDSRSHRGPARIADPSQRGKVTHASGHDVENPT